MRTGSLRVSLAIVFLLGLSTLSLAQSGTSCSTGATPRTVVICDPISNTTANSPVHITAAVHSGSAAVKVVQVYVDGIKKYETGISGLGQADNGDLILNVDIGMTAGLHRVTVQALDSSGAFKATVFVTVPSTGTGCSTTGAPRTIVICQPANGAISSSPVHVTAAVHLGTGSGGTLRVVQVYVDGVKKFETNLSGLGNADNGDLILNTDIGLAAGLHRLTVQALDMSGAYKKTVTMTVQ